AHPPGIYRRDKVKNPAVPSQSVLKKWRLSALAIGSTPLERAAGLLAWLDTAGAGAASTTRIVTAPMRKLGVAAFCSGSRSSARADLAIRGAAVGGVWRWVFGFAGPVLVDLILVAVIVFAVAGAGSALTIAGSALAAGAVAVAYFCAATLVAANS